MFLTVKSRESTSKSVKIFASGGRYPSEAIKLIKLSTQAGLVLFVNLYLYEWYNVHTCIYNSVIISKARRRAVFDFKI